MATIPIVVGPTVAVLAVGIPTAAVLTVGGPTVATLAMDSANGKTIVALF